MSLNIQDAPVESVEAAEEAAAAAVDPAVKQGFSDLVSRFTDGDFSADTWMLAWETIGQPVALALVLIIAVVIGAGWIRRMVLKACRKANVEETLARFLSNMVRYLVLFAGGIAILGTLGIETTSFAAVLAAAGFAVGMALSGMLGNVAAGVMLLFFRPFKVGDVVSAGGTTGKVVEIGLFTTAFDTPDNKRIIVPNGGIFGDTIENVSFHDTRRVDVAVGTDYGADIDKTRAVLLEAAKASPSVLQDPEPAIVLANLGGSSIDWEVRVWAKSSDYFPVKDGVTRDVKYALDNAGIGIPFPQMDVHLDGKVAQS
ncbi:MAG: mechanosensitive ion channel family protein [Phycisphaerales bacterium]